MTDYPIVIFRLPPEDGTGYIAKVPDLCGCMSDGETPEEALLNVQDAITQWVDESNRIGRTVPKPMSSSSRLTAERNALIAGLKAMVEQYDRLDARIEFIVKELENLQELYDCHDIATRVSDISAHSYPI